MIKRKVQTREGNASTHEPKIKILLEGAILCALGVHQANLV
jgi:hypothetical protein